MKPESKFVIRNEPAIKVREGLRAPERILPDPLLIGLTRGEMIELKRTNKNRRALSKAKR